MLDRLLQLAERLRALDIDVSTSEVIDAARGLATLDLHDHATIRACVSAALVKRADQADSFERCFEAIFGAARGTEPELSPTDESGSSSDGTAGAHAAHAVRRTPTPTPTASAFVGSIDDAVLQALLRSDDLALAALADQAVAQYSGIDGADGSERYFMHRVLRELDLSRMLSAAMLQLRSDGGADEMELMLQRGEVSRRLAEFRRRLAAEIARRLEGRTSPATAADLRHPEDLDLLGVGRAEADELHRLLQPLLRRLATRLGQRRRPTPTGRLDVRRTIRRSQQTGGVPIEAVVRRRHPYRPEIVVLCDVSGSVAEFARFTFTLVNALHAENGRVRSFAFVDGDAEVTDIFATARYEIPVNRLVERRGVIGLDGHSDYGAVFRDFSRNHLSDCVGSATTVLITGDARGNHRHPTDDAFAELASRARRVYWLNPEPQTLWGTDDSLVEYYRRSCTKFVEVRTLRQLSHTIVELI